MQREAGCAVSADIGQEAVLEHVRHCLDIGQRGGTYFDAFRLVGAVAFDVMQILAARGLVARNGFAHGDLARRLHGDRPIRHVLDHLPDDLVGLHEFQHADHGAAVHIAMIIRDHIELDLVIGGIGIILADVATQAARPPRRTDRPQPNRILFRKFTHTRKPLNQRGLRRGHFYIVFGALFQGVDALEHGLFELFREVAPHAADGVDAIVDAVARDGGQQVHDDFPIRPGVHQQRVEAHFMAGHTQPKQVRMHALQFPDQCANEGRTHGNLQPGDLLDRLDKASGMGMRANAADAFNQIHILDIGARLAGLFNAAVVVPQANARPYDALSLQHQLKTLRLFECRMLRTDGYFEPVLIRHCLAP